MTSLTFFSTAEMSDDCVSKFASLVRSRDLFLPHPNPGEILSFGMSPVNYADTDKVKTVINVCDKILYHFL